MIIERSFLVKSYLARLKGFSVILEGASPRDANLTFVVFRFARSGNGVAAFVESNHVAKECGADGKVQLAEVVDVARSFTSKSRGRRTEFQDRRLILTQRFPLMCGREGWGEGRVKGYWQGRSGRAGQGWAGQAGQGRAGQGRAEVAVCRKTEANRLIETDQFSVLNHHQPTSS